MKIDALTRLFYSGSLSSSNPQPQSAVSSESANGANDSDAASVSARVYGDDEDTDARRRRVQDLKREVADGTYRRDSNAVAAKLYQDLFA